MSKTMRLATAVCGLLLISGAAHAQAPAAPPAAAATAHLSPAQVMAQNAQAPGVKTLPSGLQYKIVHSGDPVSGSPKAGDIVKVNYEGTLTSGEIFDSSFARGKPAIMALADLVPAWMEAVPMMHTGDEWVLYVPPALGYGDEGGGPIPPNSVLIFRLQLLGFLTAD